MHNVLAVYSVKYYKKYEIIICKLGHFIIIYILWDLKIK